MNGPTARTSTALGILALVAAVVAAFTDQEWLVLVAAGVAILSVALLLQARHRESEATRRLPVHLPDHAAPGPLDPEALVDDGAREAAARFEADAIRAREELVALMRDEQLSRTTPAGVEEREAAPATASGAAPPSADAIVDQTSGLFSEVFFAASLVKRVSAARRGLRPLSVAVLDVWVDFGSLDSRQAPPAPVAELLIEVFREADTIARTPDGLYLVLLEDTPENGAVWSLERLRRRVSEALPNHTTWAGVSCYPAYGFDAEQLVAQARKALELAKEWPQDRVEVTAESPD
jgi:PleD family two-component response regulator